MPHNYEVNIGIEVHVQLTTKSKIFCSCENTVDQKPNTNICPICTGQPGVLPALNKQVIEYALQAGIATHCNITEESYFARKHYFYPDLPKGYQTTQHNEPICTNGYVTIFDENNNKKNIRLTRIHIEEDAGKNIHSQESEESFVNLNRAGTPLLEIVTYPDITSSHQAREYLKSLRQIVQYLNICTGNMEEGAFRADTNISVRPQGQEKLGTKCELKNINSFKFISDAIEYEIERQISVLESGGKIKQETRLWDTKERKTVPMRSKEEAADYRYFQDPDLPIIKVTQQDIEHAQSSMPELPLEKLERLQKQYNLSQYEADILITDKDLAAYYEQAAQSTSSKSLINWILREVMGTLKEQSISIKEFSLSAQQLAKLVNLLENNIINNRAAQEVFALMLKTKQDPEVIVKEHGLEQIGNTAELEKIIANIIEANPKQVSSYKGGQEKLFGFFVGQAMKQTQGKGNPQLINELLKKYLS